MVYSILVLAAESGYREQICREITHGLHCRIYTASDTQAALTLVRAEQPTLFLVSPEFARVHNTPLSQLVAELSPTTVVAFLASPAHKAVPASS